MSNLLFNEPRGLTRPKSIKRLLSLDGETKKTGLLSQFNKHKGVMERQLDSFCNCGWLFRKTFKSEKLTISIYIFQ